MPKILSPPSRNSDGNAAALAAPALAPLLAEYAPDRDAGPDRGAVLSRHAPRRHGCAIWCAYRARRRRPSGSHPRVRPRTRQRGQAVRGAMVEIWQCDAQRHLQSPRRLRPATPRRGIPGLRPRQVDGSGRYDFRTIRPVAYPGRTPHIHFKVHAPGAGRLTTQMYVAGERAERTRRRAALASAMPRPVKA